MSFRKNRTMNTFWRFLVIFVLLGQCSGHFESVTAVSQNGGCLDSNSECENRSGPRRRHLRRDTSSEDDDKKGGWLSKNFVMTDNLPDGEKEMRIHFNGVTAKETSVGNNGSGLVLRQFTDGRHFVQTILTKDNKLLDCEYVDQRSAVKSFVRNFRKEIRGSPHINPKRRKHRKNNPETTKDHSETTKDHSETRHFHDDDFEPEAHPVLESYYDDSGISVDVNVKPASDGRRQSWRRRRGFRARRATHMISHGLWNVTVEDLEDGQLPREVADWLDFDKAIGQCDEIHERMRSEYGMDDDGSSSNGRSSRSPADRGRSRRVARNAFLIPGTKWCGKGNLGVKHNHLGEFTSADRCCRKHDNGCPFWIDGASEKYGLFNWRPNTLMHCRCDERFRSCLKLADTDVANMVGRLFFNIVQTKCFVLKPVKVCLERSWWGKCLKKGYAKQAHLRDNLEY